MTTDINHITREAKILFDRFFRGMIAETIRIVAMPDTFHAPKIGIMNIGREVSDMLHDDVAVGRIFDFGAVADSFIADMSVRSRIMPHLMPPFDDWRGTFFAHHWDVALGCASVYVFLGGKGGRIRIAELGYIPEQEKCYLFSVISFTLPFGKDPRGTLIAYSNEPIPQSVNSIINPCLAFLTILNTKGAEYAEYRLPRAERRRMAKEGLPTPPSAWTVNSGLYFTAMKNERPQKTGIESGRASPVPHLRRGHWREQETRRLWIRDTIVNARSSSDPAFVDRLKARKAYRF